MIYVCLYVFLTVDTTHYRFVVSGLVMGYAVDRTNRVAIIGKHVPVEK